MTAEEKDRVRFAEIDAWEPTLCRTPEYGWEETARLKAELDRLRVRNADLERWLDESVEERNRMQAEFDAARVEDEEDWFPGMQEPLKDVMPEFFEEDYPPYPPNPEYDR